MYRDEIFNRMVQLLPSTPPQNIENFLAHTEKLANVCGQNLEGWNVQSNSEEEMQRNIEESKPYLNDQASGRNIIFAYNIACTEYRLNELQAPRREAERRIREEEERRAREIAEASARAAAEAAARVLAEQAAENERKEKERLKAEEEARIKAEQERLKAEEEARIKAEQERLKAEEEARIKASEANKNQQIQAKDEIIKKQDEIIDEKDKTIKKLEEALALLEKAKDIKNLADAYLALSTQKPQLTQNVSNNTSTFFANAKRADNDSERAAVRAFEAAKQPSVSTQP